MAGASSPGAPSRPGLKNTASRERFAEVVALLDKGWTYRRIREAVGCGDQFITKASLWRAERERQAAARGLPPAAPPPSEPVPVPPPSPPRPPCDLRDLSRRLAAVATFDAVGRAFLIADLRMLAEAEPDADERAHYLHLCDLVVHHGAPYPEQAGLRASSRAPLVLLPATVVHGLGSSPAASCLDA